MVISLCNTKQKKFHIAHLWIQEYVEILASALENKLAVGILRVRNGLDFSQVIGIEESVVVVDDEKAEVATDQQVEEKEAQKKEGCFSLPLPAPRPPKLSKPQPKKPQSRSIFHGKDGQPLAPLTVRQIEQFRGGPPLTGHIDVWWLHDDGGLTILLPHILQTRKLFQKCKLRVFSAGTGCLNEQSASFAKLLTKFRIDFAEVNLIPGLGEGTKEPPGSRIAEEFGRLLAGLPAGAISATELVDNAGRTNRHLRLAELLREHSIRAELVVVTLPLPRRRSPGSPPPALYMAWLEVMTCGLPSPVLLIRGNQESVLTFYS
jgi:solute carrier family 12 sodium/potassium/chloride transporter 2